MFKELLEVSKRHLEQMEMSNLSKAGLDRTLETYFLVGPYPPLEQMSECRERPRLIKDMGNKDGELVDLYLHFPYCRVVGEYECVFCPFYKERHDSAVERALIEGWVKEIELYKKSLGNFKVRTIYFGGGTVSLIDPKNLRFFVNYLWKNVGLEDCQEVKFEIHADASKTPDKLNEILDILKTFTNVKIIVDIQSLNQQTLEYVSWRRVSLATYFNTLEMIIKKGFNCICAGIILGLPFETPESFLHGVSQLVTVPEIRMLSIYPLMFRKCDHVFKFLNIAPELMLDVKKRDVVSIATRRLLKTFGFSESPLYFYSREGVEPVHQRKKLESESCLIGIGPSAFGHINGSACGIAYYNTPSISKYIEQVKLEFPFWRTYNLNETSMFLRSLVKGRLNMLRSISLSEFPNSLKDRLETVFGIFENYGLLSKNDDWWDLTEKGILRIEEMSYFLAEIEFGEQLTGSDAMEKSFNSSYNCFPNRTLDQISSWKSEYKKHICVR